MDMIKKFGKRLVTSKDKLYKNPAKVGQAVYDIISKSQASQTVEETIEAMTGTYFKKIVEAVEEGCKAPNYPSVFYILIERKKETLAGNASNVLKHKYITVPFKPKPRVMRQECPNSDFDLYEANKKKCEITHIWTLPCYQDSVTILKNEHLYDPQLVKWIKDFNMGILDL